MNLRFPLSLSSLMLVLLGVTASMAGTCVLAPACSGAQPCPDSGLALEWTTHTKGTLSVNGSTFSAIWHREGVDAGQINSSSGTFTVKVNGPVLTAHNETEVMYFRPLKDANETIATVFPRVRRYVDHEDAMSRKVTYRGKCEGLF